MNSNINYSVHPKENLYFTLKVIFSLAIYAGLVGLYILLSSIPTEEKAGIYGLVVYAVLIILFLVIRFGVLIGHLKGNAIKVRKDQFPDLYRLVVSQAEALRMTRVPEVYILQSGGILNAFAARFIGRNYVVLYSEVVEAAYEQNPKILEFIVGHELGHIKRGHMMKRFWLWPSSLVPFLGAAYSRACEYTCDRIGFALSPEGATAGLLILASGRSIYKKVNVKAYIDQDYSEDGFWKWFAEKVSSHPNLTKRVAEFVRISPKAVLTEVPVEKPEPPRVEDHSRYMPQF
jgi:Zn-dependent protease with chaperone function